MNPRALLFFAWLGTAGLSAQTAPETAQAALARGDPAAAIAALDPHLRTQPDDVPALFLRSVAAERAGDLTGAVLFSGRALDTQRRLQPDAKPFASHLARHRDLFDRLVAAHPAPVAAPTAPRRPTLPAVATPTATPPSAPATFAGRQWAISAQASSEYRATNYSATQATGAPNVRAHSDSGSAWAPKTEDGGPEWLELTYAKAVRATGVRVVQSFNPGCVTKIDIIDDAGTATTIWSGPDATAYPPNTIGALEVSFPATARPVAKVKITLDTKLVRGANEIDAVELTGLP